MRPNIQNQALTPARGDSSFTLAPSPRRDVRQRPAFKRWRVLITLSFLGATLGQDCLLLPSPAEDEHETQISDFSPMLAVSAMAGPDQVVFGTEEVVLDGSASQARADSQYLWEQIGGPVVELVDAASLIARFLAPAFDAAAVLEFRLTVTRGGHSSSDATVVQILPPLVPVDIGIHASILEGAAPLTVALAAFRHDGQPLPDGAFSWDFGDETAGEGSHVTHVFPHPASYTVMLCTVLNDGFVSTGCSHQTVNVIDGSAGLVISGFIHSQEVGVPGVLVTATGVASAVTDSNGGYALTVPAYWSGELAPQHQAHVFEPASYSYVNLPASAVEQNFAAIHAPPPPPPPGDPMILGQVVNHAGHPRPGVTLVFSGTDASAGQTFTTVTGADGRYVQALPSGWTGTVRGDQNFRLDPAFQTYANVTAAVGGQNYTSFRNYYVATSGSDAAAGTFAAPLASPQAAADRTQPGDTVHIRGGTYSADGSSAAEAVLRVTRSGLPNRPITYKAYAGETVVFRSDGVRRDLVAISVRPSDQHYSSGEGVQHIIIEGLIVEGATRTGIAIYGPANLDPPTAHITVRRCIARNNIGGGIGTRGKVNNVVIEYCEAYQNLQGGIGFGRMSKNFHVGEPETNMNAASYSTIRHCLAYNNAHPTTPGNTDGIDGSHTYRCNFVDNVIYGNSDDGLDIYASVEANVSRNIVFNHRHPEGNGAGIKVSAGGGGRHVLARNVSFNNASYGLEASKPSLTLVPYYASTFYNNVAYRTGSPSLSIGDDSAAGTWVLHNNIAVESSGSSDFKLWSPSNTVSNHNVWRQSDLNNCQSAGQDLNSLTGNPGFRDPGTSINTSFESGWSIEQKLQHIRSQVRARFSLRENSICRNAGVNVGLAFNGPAPDIGAYESE